MEPFVLRGEDDGPRWFDYPAWQGVKVGFSTRLGGVSRAPYSSLNLAFHVNDQTNDIIRNRQLLADSLHLPLEAWTCAEQIHGDHVSIVTSAELGSGRIDRATAIADTDALVTNLQGVWLTSFYADCVPLYFYDPVQRVIGLAHAGWRGTAKQIAMRTVQKMTEVFASQPSDIRAIIGPSIGACCYEVDEHVANQVSQAATVISAEGEQSLTSHTNHGSYTLNLKRANQFIMMKAGISLHHIEISEWCTSCRTDLFFSHRKEHGTTGRMVSWACLSD
jgi:YfiH family protein